MNVLRSCQRFSSVDARQHSIVCRCLQSFNDLDDVVTAVLELAEDWTPPLHQVTAQFLSR